MKLLVRLNGYKACSVCEFQTNMRIWDTDDKAYSLPVCRYHSDRKLNELRGNMKPTIKDLLKVFTLVEWIIVLLILTILVTLGYSVFN